MPVMPHRQPARGLHQASSLLRCVMFVLAAALLTTSGCAGLQFGNPLNLPGDVHAKKEERKAELIRDFELKRGAALLNAAQTRLGQGDEAGASEALRQLIKLAPDNVTGHLLMAEIHLLKYELEEAKQEVETVLAKSPDNPQAIHTLGLIQEALGNSEQAAESFGRAAELAPDNSQYTIDYESTIDPRYSKPGETPERSADPNGTDADGDSFNTAGKVPPVNLLALERTATSPRSVAILRRAMAAMAAGESDSAIAQVRQALILEAGNTQLPRQVALEAIRSNHPEIASAVLESALEQLPQSAELYRLYGLSLYRQQQYQSAEIALRKAVSLDNRDALAYFLLGQALARLGQSDQSHEFLQEACRLDPSLSVQTRTR